MDISITELEQAINHWRALKPSTGEEHTLSPEVNALAGIYAVLIYQHRDAVPLAALDANARQLIDTWLAQHARASA